MKLDSRSTEIIAIRHGETEWNRLGIQQGQLDSPLTETGELQARLAGRRLSRDEISALYCSDLGRAMRTAEIIGAQTGHTPESDAGLRERNLGIMQGMTLEEFSRRNPAVHRKFIAHDPDYVVPQGESLRQRYERSVTAVARIAALHHGKTIMIVMHGGNLDSLYRHVTGYPLDRQRNFSLYNTAVNRFILRDNTWFIATWGDISHLAADSTLDDY